MRQEFIRAPILKVIFVSLTENSYVVTNNTQGPLEISTLPEIALETQFHVQHGTKTTWHRP